MRRRVGSANDGDNNDEKSTTEDGEVSKGNLTLVELNLAFPLLFSGQLYIVQKKSLKHIKSMYLYICVPESPPSNFTDDGSKMRRSPQRTKALPGTDMIAQAQLRASVLLLTRSTKNVKSFSFFSPRIEEMPHLRIG